MSESGRGRKKEMNYLFLAINKQNKQTSALLENTSCIQTYRDANERDEGEGECGKMAEEEGERAMRRQ